MIEFFLTANPANIKLSDLTDQPFFEVAQTAQVSALITGDVRDFPPVKELITPSQFMDLYGRL